MPSHTKTERAKKTPKKKKPKVRKPKKRMEVKKSAEVATFAERMGWTCNTEEIQLKGNLQPTVEEYWEGFTT